MTRDEELAQISEMRKEYKSMPSFIDGRRNPIKSGLYQIIEMKMRAFDMKDKYRGNNDKNIHIDERVP